VDKEIRGRRGRGRGDCDEHHTAGIMVKNEAKAGMDREPDIMWAEYQNSAGMEGG